MNDISVSSTLLKSILFADDTTLNTVLSLFPSNNGMTTSNLINRELDKITEWLRANKLSLNAKKTKYMIFRYSQTPKRNIPNLDLRSLDLQFFGNNDCLNTVLEFTN